jgi:hypothetical protein
VNCLARAALIVFLLPSVSVALCLPMVTGGCGVPVLAHLKELV